MSITYKVDSIKDLLLANEYAGRGIVIGKSADGKKAVFAYFIMGRSANSRNRIFSKTEDGIIIYPHKPELVEDPSLIIYSPVRKVLGKTVVTNGDQTDTVVDFIKDGKTFEQALKTRCFEPDAPNLTPRISGMLEFEDGFTYKMSILKSGDEVGSKCFRYTFDYDAIDGLGHFIHTYEKNGNPIPTFRGEPERVSICDDIDEFTNGIWESLNEENKISLYVSFTDLATGKEDTRLINKNK